MENQPNSFSKSEYENFSIKIDNDCADQKIEIKTEIVKDEVIIIEDGPKVEVDEVKVERESSSNEWKRIWQIFGQIEFFLHFAADPSG